MKQITWAIRLTLDSGRAVFVRTGGVFGRGGIKTFSAKEQAEAEAARIRQTVSPTPVVTVIERSHGRLASHKETP